MGEIVMHNHLIGEIVVYFMKKKCQPDNIN